MEGSEPNSEPLPNLNNLYSTTKFEGLVDSSGGPAGALERHWHVDQLTFARYSGLLGKDGAAGGHRWPPWLPSYSCKGRSVLLLPIIPPDHWVGKACTALMGLVDSTWSAFGIIWTLTFCNGNGAVAWVNIGFGVVYVLDMVIEFERGYFIHWAGRCARVDDGALIARRYMFRSTFFADLMSTIPTAFYLFLDDAHGSVGPVQLLRALRLVRIFRVIHALRDNALVSAAHAIIHNRLRKLSLSAVYALYIIYISLLALNFFGCVWFMVGQIDEDDSWLVHVGSTGQDLVDASVWVQYITSAYYIMTTVTTVGYGDITANNWYERLVAILLLALGTLGFGIIIGAMTSLMTNNDPSSTASILHDMRGRLARINQLINYYGMQKDMQMFTHTYWNDYIQLEQIARQDEVINSFPPAARIHMAAAMLRRTIGRLPGPRVVHNELRVLLSYAVLTHLHALHDLYLMGDAADSLYILESGTIAMLQYEETLTSVEGPSWLGDPRVLMVARGSMQPPVMHACTARAATGIRVWQVPLRTLKSLGEMSPGLLDDLLRHLEGAEERREAAAKRSASMLRRHTQLARATLGPTPPLPHTELARATLGPTPAVPTLVGGEEDAYEERLDEGLVDGDVGGGDWVRRRDPVNQLEAPMPAAAATRTANDGDGREQRLVAAAAAAGMAKGSDGRAQGPRCKRSASLPPSDVHGSSSDHASAVNGAGADPARGV